MLVPSFFARTDMMSISMRKGKSQVKGLTANWQGIENWSEETDVLDELRSFGIDLSFDYVPVCELDLHFSDKIRTLTGDNACYLVKRGTAEGLS